MPNWCANSLTVSGPQADLDAFREKAKCPPTCERREGVHEGGVGLCPHAFIEWTGSSAGWTFPMRRDAEDVDDEEDDGAAHLRIAATPTEVEGEEEGQKVPALCYEFVTRWGAPIDDGDWLREASLQHPALRFVIEYAEPLMDFSGRVQFEAGKQEEQMRGQARDAEDLASEAPFFY